METLDFDGLSRQELTVKYGSRVYILVEADEDAHCRYQNCVMKATKLGADGNPVGIDGLADAAPLLLSRCLYHADGEGKLPLDKEGLPDPKFLVSLQKIRTWPQRMTTQLFEKLKEISGIDEAKPEAVKKQIERLQARLARAETGKNSDNATVNSTQ